MFWIVSPAIFWNSKETKSDKLRTISRIFSRLHVQLSAVLFSGRLFKSARKGLIFQPIEDILVVKGGALMLAALILIPIAFALLRHHTKKYIFSALTTLSCAAIALPFAPVMAAALFISFIGDYFMAHKGKNEVKYLLGIAGFFLGHVVFIVHAMLYIPFAAHEAFFLGITPRTVYIREGLLTGAVMALCFTPYLLLRVIKKVPKLLQIPVALYTLISIAGLACAVMTGNWIYILGVAMLLFSDTMIAENDFVGNRKVSWLILPTYYLCHILVALSAVI